MRMYDLILKKKQRGKELNTEEINWMIKEFTEGGSRIIRCRQ